MNYKNLLVDRGFAFASETKGAVAAEKSKKVHDGDLFGNRVIQLTAVRPKAVRPRKRSLRFVDHPLLPESESQQSIK